MKQITIKKIQELGGYVNNNHIANALINYLDEQAKLADSIGFHGSAKAFRRESKALYDELDKYGYWDSDLL